MHDSASQDVIAVDGGGTSCRIALASGGAVTFVKTGRANVASDFAGAITNITGGLAQLARETGIPLAQLCRLPAYLGLAGVLHPDIAARVAQALPLNNAKVEDDRVCALVGSLGARDGAVAALGTGSFLARQTGTTTRLIGGYGLILGDEASGAWLGRALLRRVLHVADGLEPASPLTDAARAEFESESAIVDFAANAQPQAFGAFAPRIVAAAQAGDAIGVDLMLAGATYIRRGLRALDWQPAEALCLIGGVGPHYAAYLPAAIADALRPPEGTALDGAVTLARRLSTKMSGDPE